MGITVAIADDHMLFASGLCSLLKTETDIEIVALASNGSEAVQIAHKDSPNIMLMDVEMPGMDGIEATRSIVADSYCSTKVIALSMYCDKHHVSMMINAGAKGYLLKDSVFEDLVQAIHTVAEGQSFLSPAITGHAIRQAVSNERETQRRTTAALTRRETEILGMLAEGQTSKEIASKLFISTKTVENHRKNIINKLDIHSVAELTKFAIRSGISSL